MNPLPLPAAGLTPEQAYTHETAGADNPPPMPTPDTLEAYLNWYANKKTKKVA